MPVLSRRTALGAACAALALLVAPLAWATVGTPIQGIPVGLEGDPGSIRVAESQTDAKGEVVFSNLKAGKYAIVILDGDRPKATISQSGATVATIAIGGHIEIGTWSWGQTGGKTVVTDKAGRRLVIPVARDGGEIRVQLSIFDRWGKTAPMPSR
ncbi:MAG: hypothetical protein Q8L66_15155 [Caulobacter sp.]|nr:hypothetical protein [Caulobacter sp.]